MTDPEVEGFQPFIEAMYTKLLKRRVDKKDTPRGKLGVHALLDFLSIEMLELKAAIDHLTLEEVRDEAVDVAGFAMLIHKRATQYMETEKTRRDKIGE